MLGRLANLFRTEPAIFTNAVQAVIGIVAAFGIGFTADQTAAILAVTGALLAVVTAILVRDVTPAVFTGLVTAAGVLVAAYGIHLSADLVGSLNLLITSLFAMLTRMQVTPVVTLKRRQAARLAAAEARAPLSADDLARKIAARLNDSGRQGSVPPPGFR